MKKIISMLCCIALTALMFSSCGANKMTGAYDGGAYDADFANAEYGWDQNSDVEWSTAEAVEAPMEANPDTDFAQGSSKVPKDSARKIIKRGDLTLETLEFDKFIDGLENSVSQYSGYIESSSRYGSGSNRSADYTVRVPEQNYDVFISAVGGLGTVISTSTSTEDVTLTYVDVEARLAAYKAERDSFMELLDKAETVEEILRIQDSLTDVNYRIESYTTQLNTMKDLVSYSTVHISVDEVARVTPPEPKTVWERISTQLSENIYRIGEDAKDFFVGFVSSIPYIVIYGVIIGVIIAVIVVIAKSNKKKQLRRIEEYANAHPPIQPTDSNIKEDK